MTRQGKTTASDEMDAGVAEPTVRVFLSPDVASVAVARSAVRRAVRFDTDDLASRFLTALTEIVVNAIEQHQGAESESSIIVDLDLGDGASVAVANEADGGSVDLDARSVGHTDDVRNSRGRGLSMARVLVPAMTISQSDSDIRITLPLRGFGSPS